VAGGGAGGFASSNAGGQGGGGAGGFITSFPGGTKIALDIGSSTPITIGGGGATNSTCTSYNPGSPSIFSTITSAGGGGGGTAGNNNGQAGGSGGGANFAGTGGAGNTPPVSPSQGNAGGNGGNPGGASGAGGGGASAAGATGPGGRTGGAGSANSISGSPVFYAGGGGGSGYTSKASGGTGGGGTSATTVVLKYEIAGGLNEIYDMSPVDGVISSIRAFSEATQSGTTDINIYKNGVSIFDTEILSIPPNEQSSSASTYNLDTFNFNSFDVLRFSASSVADQTLKIYVSLCVSPICSQYVQPTAQISPSSISQFTNVTLSGSSSNLTNPIYVWTLSNFKNTSDTTVTSYTGQTLPTGYFTSSGSSNVSLTVTGDEGLVIANTFNVTSFTPATISNLKSWYDATQGITLVGGEVDQWADQSGNGYTLTAPTSSERPNYSAYTLNSLPLLSSAAGGKKLSRNTYGLNSTISGATIYVIGTLLGGGQTYERLVTGGFSNQFWIGKDATNQAIQGAYQANVSPYGSIVSITYGTYYTICLSGTTSESNVILNDTTAGTVFTYNPDYSDQGFAIFANAGGEGTYTDGRGAVGEIIVYDKTVTSTENTTITRYLRNKWQHY